MTILNDVLVVTIVCGFGIIVAAKFMKKEPKELLKNIKEWLVGAFKDEEEE